MRVLARTFSKNFSWKKGLLAVSLYVFLTGCHTHAGSNAPSITFSKVPPANEGGSDKIDTIEGRVFGAQPGQQIVLFAKAAVWWVQPLANQSYTKIQADGTWSSGTHLGTEYAALLVNPGYQPPATTEKLPTVGAESLQSLPPKEFRHPLTRQRRSRQFTSAAMTGKFAP